MKYVERWNRNRVEWLYQLARHRGISPAAVRVGLLFGTFLRADEREEVSPGYDWLMENSHLSRATVARALVELEKSGMLHIERFHRYRNHYSLPFDGESEWKLRPLSSKIERH